MLLGVDIIIQLSLQFSQGLVMDLFQNYLLSKEYDDSLSDLARDFELAKYGRYYR